MSHLPLDTNGTNLSKIASTDSTDSDYNDVSNDAPIAFTGRTEEAAKRGRRSSSFGSGTFDRLRKTLSSSSQHSGASAALSVQDIYGDMDPNEINLRRTATRTTILTSLSQRVNDAEKQAEDSEASRELEKTLYEDLPDTSVPTKDHGTEFASLDPELITWDGPDDPDYPRNWTFRRKCFVTCLVSLYTLISPVSSSILSPAMTEIGDSFGITSQTILSLIVSIMVLAWSIGPLFIAPLSESDKIGRKPVLNVSIWFLFVFNIGCAFAQNTTQMCIFRFLAGFGGCAPLSVGAGVLSDVWSNERRNRAMSIYSLSPTLGPVIAPVISGFIVEKKDWRWVFYVLCMFNGCMAVVGTIFYEETYSPALLRIKAQKLRKETGNENLKTIYEIADGETQFGKIYLTVSRPVKLLFTHPMVFGLGSFMAFTYGFMYLMIVTFPDVWNGLYGFNSGITGLMYIPMGIGFLLGILVWTIVIDKSYAELTRRNGGVAKPEYRLPILCFSGVGIPIGLIWYGWSAQKQLHWIMPSIGSAIFAFSLIAVFQSIQNYLIDMNTRFAASSVAAAAVFRSLFGFSFPLWGPFMYDRLHYGWGNTLMAFIGLLLGVPFPVFVLMYGERIRNWANRKMEAEQAKRDAKNLARLTKQQEIQARGLASV